MKPRISKIDLERDVADGKTVSQIAKERQASKSSISERLKRLGLTPVKAKKGCRALISSSEGMDMQGVDPASQLQQINDLSIEILNKAIRSLRKQGGKDITDPLSVCLRTMKELRDQMSLRLSIAEKVHDMALREAEQEFREEVLEVIGEVSTDVREKILERLKERRTARRAFTGD